MFCRECGQRIEDESVYCKYCGTKQTLFQNDEILGDEGNLKKDGPLSGHIRDTAEIILEYSKPVVNEIIKKRAGEVVKVADKKSKNVLDSALKKMKLKKETPTDKIKRFLSKRRK